jgi:hypothetical protein
MNWKKVVVAVGVVLVMIIAFAIYFKAVVVLAIPWQAIKVNATTIAAVAAIIAALIAFVVYIENKKANAYRYLADLYYEIVTTHPCVNPIEPTEGIKGDPLSAS